MTFPMEFYRNMTYYKCKISFLLLTLLGYIPGIPASHFLVGGSFNEWLNSKN